MSYSDERIIIIGGPNSGKSYYAEQISGRYSIDDVKYTDSLIETYSWEEIAEMVSNWFIAEAPWIICGMMCCRGLRYWFRYNNLIKPCDRIIFIDRIVDRSTRQKAMFKVMNDIWNEILPEVKRRGIRVERIKFNKLCQT